MNCRPSTAEPTQDEDAAYYRGVLHTLIDMGANIAKILHDQIAAPANGEDLLQGSKPEAAAAFDRIARSVRRSILLARKVAEPIQPPAATSAPSQATVRRQVLRNVEDAIHRHVADPARADALHAELLDRLDGPDLDEDLLHRPVADVIEEIRRDLGLVAASDTRPGKRRTANDIAILRARASRHDQTRQSRAPIAHPEDARPGTDPP